MQVACSRQHFEVVGDKYELCAVHVGSLGICEAINGAEDLTLRQLKPLVEQLHAFTVDKENLATLLAGEHNQLVEDFDLVYADGVARPQGNLCFHEAAPVAGAFDVVAV